VCIAAFSDIHGNLAALEAVPADIEQRKADHLVCEEQLTPEQHAYSARPANPT
jgi:hypothetical protein